MSFYNREELLNLGFQAIGENVQIDRRAVFYSPERISIASHVRIDAFCMISSGLTGQVRIGNYVHIACGVYLFGGSGIELEDFVGLSAKVTVFSESDDFSGCFLTGPTVPSSMRKALGSPVLFRKHVVVGSGTVVMPGVTFGVGSASGALSLVKVDVDDFVIVGGSPAKKIGVREREILRLEEDLTRETAPLEHNRQAHE